MSQIERQTGNSAAQPAVLTLTTARVGAPGNPSVAVVPFTDAIYRSCAQGGNAVEWTDTITPPPFGVKGPRVWRRLHGGIANAPAYQLWLSAVGLQPQDNAFYTATYPWLGFRIGVVGKLSAGSM